MARTPLDEFEAELGVDLSDVDDEEEVDTLGGLVFLLTGRVPARGEVVPHPSGVEFEVIDADPRRIKRLRVRAPKAERRAHERRPRARVLAGGNEWLARLGYVLRGRRRGGPRAGALRPLADDALRSCGDCVACGNGRRSRAEWCASLLDRRCGILSLTLHWIVEPFLVDAARHGWMAPFALVLFAGGLALFWAAGRLARREARSNTHRPRAGLRPALTLAEAARGTILTGFPWAFPGHALIDTPWLLLSGIRGRMA
jgi:hypothetical protein